MEKIITKNNPLRATNIKLINTKFLLVSISFILVLFSGIKVAEAATLYFSPSSGSYAIGQTFNVSLYVSSANEPMNASQGIINFPADKLQITNLSKSNSVLTLWVQDPYYSNTDGSINFAGVVPNPGFIGSSGKILTFTFKVRDSGEASLSLARGSVLANDGLGTQILVGATSANFILTHGANEPTAPESTSPTINGPLAPLISSPTHPDPGKWYANLNPKFNWLVNGDITSAKILYGKYPDSQPSVAYTPAISEKQLENITDGIYYFHVQLKNKDDWGGISHFRFQIDTVPPEPFAIKFVGGNKSDNPKPTIILDAVDVLSGIDYYKVKIGNADFIVVPMSSLNNNRYTLPLQDPGKKTILVQAYDKAGNYTTTSDEFIIDPINPPTITEYPQKSVAGEIFTIKGYSYPNSQVVVLFQKSGGQPQSQTVKTDNEGNFILRAGEELSDGLYKLWAQAIDGRGAKSYPSETLTIIIEKTAFLRIGSTAVSFLAVIIPFISLIILLIFIFLYAWHRLSRFRNELKKEVHEVETVLHQAFDFLKEEIRTQIKIIEKARTKRQLTEDEERLISRLRRDLDAAEKLVRKEIEDVRKELE